MIPLSPPAMRTRSCPGKRSHPLRQAGCWPMISTLITTRFYKLLPKRLLNQLTAHWHYSQTGNSLIQQTRVLLAPTRLFIRLATSMAARSRQPLYSLFSRVVRRRLQPPIVLLSVKKAPSPVMYSPTTAVIKDRPSPQALLRRQHWARSRWVSQVSLSTRQVILPAQIASAMLLLTRWGRSR